MVSGLPDDSHIKGLGDAQPSLDTSELAARLGAPLTYHRGGTVWWCTDFGQGISGGVGSVVGGSSVVTLDGVPSHIGGVALGLGVGTGGSDEASVGWTLPHMAYDTLGVAFTFCTSAEDGIVSLSVLHVTPDGTRTYGIRFDLENDTLGVYSHPATWLDDIGTVGLRGSNGLFHHAKLVIDLASRAYSRVYFDYLETDLSVTAPSELSLTGRFRLALSLTYGGGLTSAGSAHIDSLILTRGESI